MTPESWEKVDALFQVARALPPDERQAFLDEEPTGDASLRAEVRELLAADEQANREGFLDPAIPRSPTRPSDSIHSVGSGGAKSPVIDEIPVSLVVGSGPHQASAIESLYSSRMRSGILIILVGFASFLVKNLLWDGIYADPARRPVLWAHVAIVVAAALASPIPWSRRPLNLRGYRAVELVIMVLIAIFFALFQVAEFREAALISAAAPKYRADVLGLTGDGCALRWFAFLVFYGFFVPTTWGRCASVLGVFAICPLAVTVAVGLSEHNLGMFHDVLQEMTIWVALGWAMAVYGSHKIAQLRREAFEARKLGQYRLKRRLGSGGMGEVWLAEHQFLKRPCAIKLIRHELVGDAMTLLRFQREVQATAMLAHPNTIRIYDYGIADDGTFYYTMEYLPGLTLQELVQKFGPLPPGRAAYFLKQACLALQEAHGMGLIHRDLKPGNLIASKLGGIPDVLKLLDFGLVHGTHREPGWEKLSFQGFIAGTPAYSSPEQAGGQREVDARSDIYSVGAVGYFLLEGRPPFEGETPHHVMVAHLEQPVPPLRAPGQEIPPDLEAVIRQCLEKDPANRFPDVMSLHQALAACACADLWTESVAAEWWLAHSQNECCSENP
jgi:eukaryotic-like serine/threonine-protein kinase